MEPAEPARRRSRVGVVVALVLLIGLLGVLVIGPPLWGRGVFASTDLLVGDPQTLWLIDTIDAALPQNDLFGTALRGGAWLAWNPYILGGVPLAATPSAGLLSPLSLPIWLLPGWLSPAWVKLVEIGCAVTGMYLYLRRIRLGTPAALLGGAVFATTGFMVMWTNWPQTRVAAFIPALFWAVERLVQRRKAFDAVLVALVVAAMLLGGFPSVTGYALYTAVPYALVRTVAEYRRQPGRLFGVLGAGALALAGGVALVAWQLIPFATFMSHAHVEGRAQTAGSTLSLTTLLTIVAPYALGTGNPGNPPTYFWTTPTAINNTNLVETMAYIGAASLVLVVFAATRARYTRRFLPPAVLPLLLAGVLFWLDVCYLGGWPHSALLRLPVFGTNFIGRAQSVLGFLFATLAAIGFQLAAAPTTRRSPGRQALSHAARGAAARSALATGVRLGVLAGLIALVVGARYAARHSAIPGNVGQRLANLDRQVLIAAALLAAATLLVVLARLAGRRIRAVALAVLALLVLGQALTVTTSYLPRSARATYYPTSDVTGYLAAHLGTDRMATGWGLRNGTETIYRLRALDGHGYADARMVELFEAVPGFAPFNNTTLTFQPTPQQATSPVLDRLGVRYFLSPLSVPVFGPTVFGPPVTGGVALAAGGVLRAGVPGTGPLRAVTLTLLDRVASTTLTATVRDPAGGVVGTGRWRLPVGTANTTTPGGSLTMNIPVPAEGVPAGTPLTVDIGLAGPPVRVGTSASGALSLGVVRPADDGLRLVYAGDGVVYQRLRVLPRIRWAGRAVTVANPAARVAELASGRVPADTVVLSAPGPAGQGLPGDVSVLADDGDWQSIGVHASGSGYLVVADALQVGWRALLDGRPVPIVAADHAVGAVAVPAGTHTVELRYAAPAGGVGNWISLGALVPVLLITAAAVASSVRARRARRWRRGVASVVVGYPAPDDRAKSSV